MEIARLSDKARTLEELALKYKKVLLDTSALDATNAPQDLRMSYQRRLYKTGQHYKNLYTLDEVFSEAKLFYFNIPSSAGIIKIKESDYEPFFSEFFDNLKDRAHEYGIIGAKPYYLQTDLKLAAIAFSINAKEQGKIAFVSSDRQLADFINSNANRIRSCKDFTSAPCLGKIAIYTFIQALAKFVSYSDEKSYRKKFIEHELNF